MGFNRYVGMRYVPIFDGEWNSEKEYEPLTTVLHEGNSFISKTYVPKGTLITNESFWALAGNYNAQVEQYRQEVREIAQALSLDISNAGTVVLLKSGDAIDNSTENLYAGVVRFEAPPRSCNVVHASSNILRTSTDYLLDGVIRLVYDDIVLYLNTNEEAKVVDDVIECMIDEAEMYEEHNNCSVATYTGTSGDIQFSQFVISKNSGNFELQPHQRKHFKIALSGTPFVFDHTGSNLSFQTSADFSGIIGNSYFKAVKPRTIYFDLFNPSDSVVSLNTLSFFGAR